MGLSISRFLVEKQGGKISVTSKVNAGSAFCFTLDFEMGDPGWQGQVVHKTEGIPDNVNLSKLKVLLVDDNIINQKVAVYELKKWKIRVETANNAQQAFEKLRDDYFNLVLMDISMPGMDGLEATRYIRSNFDGPVKTVPIIAMTASALVGEKEKCFAAGMNDYISKPFDPVILFKKIVQWTNTDIKEMPADETLTVLKKQQKLVNLSVIREQAAGDPDYVKDVIRVYLESVPGYLNDFKQSIDRQQWPEVSRQSHKLKGTVAYFGMDELKEVLANIEIMTKGDFNQEDLKTMNQKVERMINQSLKDLQVALREIVT